MELLCISFPDYRSIRNYALRSLFELCVCFLSVSGGLQQKASQNMPFYGTPSKHLPARIFS